MTIFKKIWYRFKRVILKWASTMSPNAIIQEGFNSFDANSDIINKLQNKYAIIKYYEKFPQDGEMGHFNMNPNHEVEMNGLMYSLSALTADPSIFSRNTVRYHSLELNHLHRICKQSLSNHITITNAINPSNNNFGVISYQDAPLSIFERTYLYAIQINDPNIQTITKLYWKSFISKMLADLKDTDTNLYFSFINPQCIPSLYQELFQLHNRL